LRAFLDNEIDSGVSASHFQPEFGDAHMPGWVGSDVSPQQI